MDLTNWTPRCLGQDLVAAPVFAADVDARVKGANHSRQMLTQVLCTVWSVPVLGTRLAACCFLDLSADLGCILLQCPLSALCGTLSCLVHSLLSGLCESLGLGVDHEGLRY